mgnify:CR=1 FL=1
MLITDGASLFILFFVKDPIKENLIIVLEQFHQRLMEVKLDNMYYLAFDEAYLTSLNNLVINKKNLQFRCLAQQTEQLTEYDPPIISGRRG